MRQEDGRGFDDAMDYLILGADFGEEVLDQFRGVKEVAKDDVIYGVRRNEKEGVVSKINDFLIDNSKVTLKERSYFFHMLAVMVDAGVPVLTAVDNLAERGYNLRFRRILRTIAHDTRSGSKFADSMNRFEGVFDESEIGIIRSGEATGSLNVMLFKLSEELNRRYDLRLKLFAAAFYPIVVLCVLLGVGIGMLTWVFPTLLQLLTESGIPNEDLPFVTKMLIGMQGFFANYWMILILTLVAGFGVLAYYIKSDYGAVRWDAFKLRIPVLGALFRKVSILSFVSNFGLLIDAGLPMIRALKIAGSGLKNRVYKLKIQEVINGVKNGEKISKNFEDVTYLFPVEVIQMFRVGESSASLGKVSAKITEQYQREVDNSIKKLSSVFEPLMILVVGTFVGLLAVAIMAPIFSLSGNVG